MKINFGLLAIFFSILTIKGSVGANVDPPAGSLKFLTLPFNDGGVVISEGWYYVSFPESRVCEHPNDIPEGKRHCGIDYRKGSPGQTFEVIAAASGIAKRFESSTAGTYVIIKHDETDPNGQNFYTRYLHLDSTAASIPNDQWVDIDRSGPVGMAGASGEATGIHLHFEVFVGGSNPFLDPRIDPYDIAGNLLRVGTKPTVEHYPGNNNFTSCGSNHIWIACPPVLPIAIQNEEVLAISGTFSGFGGSLLNNMGDVVFSAGVDTDNDGLSEVTGIFKESQGVKSKVFATGENTPTDIGTLNFLDVTLDDFNDDGDIVFSGIWDQPAGVRHNGIFLVSGGAISNLFQSGEQITISDGTGEFTVVQNGVINEQGDLAFTATVSIAANIPSTSHIFLALSGCHQTNCLIDVAKSGDSTGIPGVGGTFDNFHTNDLFLTTNGDVVFRTIINGGETTVAYLLFERNNGSLRKIVAVGDEVAGTGVLSGVSSAVIAPIGRMAFLGKFADPPIQGVYYINDVYSNAPPSQKIMRVIEEGGQISGKDETLTLFSTGTTQVSVNGNGAVAFNGKVFGVDPLDKIDGVFVWTGGKTVQIVLEGECTPVGGAYGGASDPHINDSGKVTFFNPRIDAAAGCSPLAVNSLSPVTPLSLWAQIGKVGNMFFPSPAQAQSANMSNIGWYATISPLDPTPDVCGGGPFERSDDWFLMDEEVTGVKNYKATYGIDAGPAFTITANGCAAFSAGEEIRLHPGFRVERGGTFKASIE